VSEIRLFVSTTEALATEILDLMTICFGEEDLAIATTEVDEKNDIWEASVYMLADEEEGVRVRLEGLMAEAFPGA